MASQLHGAEREPTIARRIESVVEPRTRFAQGTLELDPRLLHPPAPDVDAETLQEHLVQIAHDLKAPLATMALEITLLDQRRAAGEDVDPRASLARLMQNVSFLDRMVHDLIDGWSPESMHAVRRLTDLRALLETVIERSTPASGANRIVFEAPRTVTLELDDLRIQRVVANMLSNALKYSPPRSTVVVRLDVHLDHCCVSVSDAGPGITQAEAGFIFDKYRRTHSSRLYPGSGLGLWVSRKIVEDHGGVMGVDNVPGGGSRFFFELALF
jgi:two-component system sensor histidine kinase VicK